MKLKKLPYNFSVCKVADLSAIKLSADFFFVGRTDEELSLVCRTEDVPENTVERDDGWRGFRIEGVLDFSLIGIHNPRGEQNQHLRCIHLQYGLYPDESREF